MSYRHYFAGKLMNMGPYQEKKLEAVLHYPRDPMFNFAGRLTILTAAHIKEELTRPPKRDVDVLGSPFVCPFASAAWQTSDAQSRVLQKEMLTFWAAPLCPFASAVWQTSDAQSSAVCQSWSNTFLSMPASSKLSITSACCCVACMLHGGQTRQAC